MTALPPPLVSADVDLRDFPFMPLDVLRLRDSDLAALADGETFKAAVLLWCVAWHQIPAGSLPHDDRVLARFACMDLKLWKKVRADALRGFVLCADQRLYHQVLAEKAVEAWHKRSAASRKGKAGARARWMQEQSVSSGTGNAPAMPQAVPTPMPKNGKGQGQGQGQGEITSPDGLVIDERLSIFETGIAAIQAAGPISHHAARTFVAGLCKLHGDEAVCEQLALLAVNPKVDPRSWLKAALKTGEPYGHSGERRPQSVVDRIEAATAARAAERARSADVGH